MQEIKTFTDYIADLCSKHERILHSKRNPHFCTMNCQVITGNSTLRYPAVLLERDQFSFVGDTDAIQKTDKYLLFILKNVKDKHDYKEISVSIWECEDILDDFLKKIQEDKRIQKKKYPFLSGFSLQGTRGEPIENLNQQLYGVVVTLEMSKPYSTALCNNPFKD